MEQKQEEQEAADSSSGSESESSASESNSEESSGMMCSYIFLVFQWLLSEVCGNSRIFKSLTEAWLIHKVVITWKLKMQALHIVRQRHNHTIRKAFGHILSSKITWAAITKLLKVIKLKL